MILDNYCNDMKSSIQETVRQLRIPMLRATEKTIKKDIMTRRRI